MTGREDEDSPSARVAVRRNGARVAIDVLPVDDAIPVSRYCVTPVDPSTYRQPLDPAGACFANADETGCDDAAPIFQGVSQGDVVEVKFLAVRGGELSPVPAAEEFDLTAPAPGSATGPVVSDLVSYGATSSSSGVLTVALTLQRDLRGLETATLRVNPEVVHGDNFEVLFTPAPVRRGLQFRQLEDGGLCSALGAGGVCQTLRRRPDCCGTGTR